MKKFIIIIASAFFLGSAVPVHALAAQLELGGQPVGIQVDTEGVTVAGISPVESKEAPLSPAQEAGIERGDRITTINGQEIDSARQVSQVLEASQGAEVQVNVVRAGQERSFRVSPVLSDDGRWMLGILLREGVSGIGTVTFVDPESGTYGALGHGISDESTGEAIPITGGSICDARIMGIAPGSPGSPGELEGCADPGQLLGSIDKNTSDGIYGHVFESLGGERVELGSIVPGRATIVSTLSGREAEEYTVEINRVTNESGEVRAILTVTDPRLIERTGGIVQGMSGSPVMQNGKLVGAVTHVFVSDPQRGCAIGINDMLRQAGIAPAA